MNLANNQSLILGIDIGGTGIKASAVNVKKGDLVGTHLKIPTPNPSTPTAMLNKIKDIITNLRWKGKIGSGFPGIHASGHLQHTQDRRHRPRPAHQPPLG